MRPADLAGAKKDADCSNKYLARGEFPSLTKPGSHRQKQWHRPFFRQHNLRKLSENGQQNSAQRSLAGVWPYTVRVCGKATQQRQESFASQS
jgi:hypothetical protein